MDKYFELGDSITKQLVEVFEKKFSEFGFIAGGGYGYDSQKYKGTGVIGDFDYICLIKDLSPLSYLSNNSFLESLGYDINTVDKFYTKDIDLFNDKFISVIRLSGKIKGAKTSINFSTFDRLNSIFISDEKIGLYKITHNKSGNILISKGTNGEDIIVSLISPEVSTWYNDSNKHYIFPDYAWIKNGNSINLGTLTDFIAKGQIVRNDNNGNTQNLQNLIISEMIAHASRQIAEKGDWYKMFASCQFFSGKFRKEINQRVEKLRKQIPFTGNYKTVLPHNSYISIFTKNEFYTSEFLSESSNKFNESKEERTLLSTLNNPEIKEIDILHIINSESKRLSSILSMTNCGTKSRPAISLSSDNCVLLDGDNFAYKDITPKSKDLMQELMDVTTKEYIKNGLDNEFSLIKYLSYLRADILSVMLNNGKGTNLNEFLESNLYKNRKETMDKLKLNI